MNLNRISKNNLTCKEVINQICEHLGELPNSPVCIAIQDHLKECGNCTNFYDSLEKTVLLYKNYSADLPEGAHERLMKVLKLADKK